MKVMYLLLPNKNMNLIVIGGTFSSRHMDFLGRNTTLALKEYYVDKDLISCRSVSLEKGITDSSESMAQIRQDIIDRSNEVFLLADHTKFDKASFFHICNLDNIHYLVTDNDLSHEWKESCQDKKIKILE